MANIPITQLFPPQTVSSPPRFVKRPEVFRDVKEEPEEIYYNIPTFDQEEGSLYIPFPAPYEEVNTPYGNYVTQELPIPLSDSKVRIVATPI